MAVTSQVLTPSPSCFSNPLSLISFHVGDNPKGDQPLWFAKDSPGFSMKVLLPRKAPIQGNPGWSIPLTPYLSLCEP